MYKCKECGYEFEEPALQREMIGEYGSMPVYEEVGCCPSCGWDDYKEIEEDD